MLRIVDGFVYEGKPSPDRFSVVLHELGNGHREAVIQRAIDWTESAPLDPDSIAAQVLRGERDDPDAEDKKRANRLRAARRAKTMVRRLCKTLGCDSLLTLTYKENVLDLAVMKRDFKEFVRRVKRVWPGFVYAAGFEPQKRGAWHAHIATHRLPRVLPASNGVKVKSFNILRAIWRSVAKERGGTVNGKNAKPWHSPARLAAYLSKYMLKAFEDGDDWSNRYSGTRLGDARPQPTRMQFNATSMGELMARVYSEVCVGDYDAFAWYSRYGDTFYIATEPEARLGWGDRS